MFELNLKILIQGTCSFVHYNNTLKVGSHFSTEHVCCCEQHYPVIWVVTLFAQIHMTILNILTELNSGRQCDNQDYYYILEK